MADRPARPCRQPGCPNLTRAGAHCQQHARTSARPNRHQRGYDNDWSRVSKAAIADQPWCSDCGHTGSPDNPLTADHILPKSRGGLPTRDNIRVLCRRCNSRRGNRG